MKIGITEIPDDFLISGSTKRWKWLNVLTDSMPPTIKLPLYQKILPILADESELDKTPATRVAIYKRIRCRGKYDEYEYSGDDYI